MHALDRPVWSSLSLRQVTLSEGNALARRYKTDVNLFASTRDDTPASLDALTNLVEAGQDIYIAQVPQIVKPDGFDELKAGSCVQMVAAQAAPRSIDPRVAALHEEDAQDMLALATLTEPGPFLKRTHTMGNFLGIRIDGQLAAMAGERMRPTGYTEVSGVCTHPRFRGLGLARHLSAAIMRQIEQRGERAFLHAWTTNHAAIALYESLGFVTRAEVNVVVLRRRD